MHKHASRGLLLLALATGSFAFAQEAATPLLPSQAPSSTPLFIEAEAAARILEAKPGASVNIGDFPLGNALVLERTVKPRKSPVLLISDDPEYIRVPEAIAFQETVEAGVIRLYVYNVNGVKEPMKMPRKISAVIENLGDKPLKMRMLHSAFTAPSGNYFELGKSGLEKFWKSEPQSSYRQIAVGHAMAVDEAMELATVEYDELVHGFYEFEISEPARISVVQTDPKTPGTTAVKSIKDVLPVKSVSGAGRGQFPEVNFSVKARVDESRGAQQLILADGKSDPWVTGTESTTPGTTATLKGNYGVMYDIEIERKGDGKALALLMYNQRYGSKWCDAMAASILIGEQDERDREVVRVPADKLNNKSLPEAVVVKVFPPLEEGKKEKIHLTYSPPGASCLPTPLVFVPVE
ncbi:copper amine oxidase [Candidatus Sumerlaeota bacterium]|nr:copper amine oxidase [Candidatus Sumerlaeota bacterium]